jgi:hypothetical protein
LSLARKLDEGGNLIGGERGKVVRHRLQSDTEI